MNLHYTLYTNTHMQNRNNTCNPRTLHVIHTNRQHIQIRNCCYMPSHKTFYQQQQKNSESDTWIDLFLWYEQEWCIEFDDMLRQNVPLPLVIIDKTIIKL